MAETYTLGYSPVAMQFVSRRTLESHGKFFIPHLRVGMRVLDCGAGPGSITQGIASRVAPGLVTAIDMDASQIAAGEERMRLAHLSNVEFRQASVYELPFADGEFDAVFSHALFEHLAEPEEAARECFRVLKPGGTIGIATPDWDGFIVAPESPHLYGAIRRYRELQNRNGGDVRMGRKLGTLLGGAGFHDVTLAARYENYRPLDIIGETLAERLEQDGYPADATALREWQRDPRGLFAQAWVSCVARKP